MAGPAHFKMIETFYGGTATGADRLAAVRKTAHERWTPVASTGTSVIVAKIGVAGPALIVRGPRDERAKRLEYAMAMSRDLCNWLNKLARRPPWLADMCQHPDSDCVLYDLDDSAIAAAGGSHTLYEVADVAENNQIVFAGAMTAGLPQGVSTEVAKAACVALISLLKTEAPGA